MFDLTAQSSGYSDDDLSILYSLDVGKEKTSQMQAVIMSEDQKLWLATIGMGEEHLLAFPDERVFDLHVPDWFLSLETMYVNRTENTGPDTAQDVRYLRFALRREHLEIVFSEIP
jgi:hypothetical protein